MSKKQEKKRTTRSRAVAFTRKQEMAELHRRKDAALAEEVCRRLEPAIKLEVAKQVNELAEVFKGLMGSPEGPPAPGITTASQIVTP